MRAGLMRDRITFKRFVSSDDGSGGLTESEIELFTVSGQYKPVRGKEVVEGDRLTDVARGTLIIRSSADTRSLVETDTAVINSVNYQIRSIQNPDRRSKVLEMVLERGVVI